MKAIRRVVFFKGKNPKQKQYTYEGYRRVVTLTEKTLNKQYTYEVYRRCVTLKWKHSKNNIHLTVCEEV